MNSRDALSIVTDVLEKVIDVQNTHTKALIEVKSTADLNEKKLDEIRGCLTNGMRSKINNIEEISKERREILEKMSRQIRENSNLIQALSEEIARVPIQQEAAIKSTFDKLAQIGWWAKNIWTTLGALTAAVIAIIYAIMRFSSS